MGKTHTRAHSEVSGCVRRRRTARERPHERQGLCPVDLEENAVAHDVVEVDLLKGQEREDAVAEVKRLSGGTSFPVLVIGDETVVGYNKVRIQQLLGL
jgi:glutaredoxin-like protein NrdH